MIKILIADHQKLLRESFKNIIESNSDICVVACASNGQEAFELCGESNPDLVLMDIEMPVCDGKQATKLIKSNYPSVKVLILTASIAESDVAETIANGADGYILKNIGTEELILSIKSTALGFETIQKDVFKPSVINKVSEKEGLQNGNKTVKVEGIEVVLTERELRILGMIVEGNDNKDIASSLFIAEGTVKNSITEIISKLQLKDRTQLAVYAIKNNLI